MPGGAHQPSDRPRMSMPASLLSALREHKGQEYLRPYRDVVRRSGACFESLLWNSPESQRARFQVIASLVDLSGRVVADIGCGRADFGAYLARHAVPVAGYRAVDALPEMIDFARTRTDLALPRVELEVVDFIQERAAFTAMAREGAVLVFSGSLNTLPQERAEVILERAWSGVERERGSLVFNFLSDYGPRTASGPTHRFDPASMLRWALTRTTRVRLRHDYLDGRDCTIAMRTKE